MTAIALIVSAYLIGSVSFAVMVSKLFRLPDPRTYGSGNPGATNVLRTGSKRAAMLTVLGDAAKGWFAVWLAIRLAPYGVRSEVIAAVAVAVFVGHLYPIFHGFHGGKGVATAFGILVALNPQLGLGALFIWLLVFYFTRISSLAAIVAAAFSPFFTMHFFGFGAVAAAVLLVALLLIWRHRSNVRKLCEGTERRVGK